MLDRLWLALQNKARVWRFGIRRFGLRVFLGEKLARGFGLGAAAAVADGYHLAQYLK